MATQTESFVRMASFAAVLCSCNANATSKTAGADASDESTGDAATTFPPTGSTPESEMTETGGIECAEVFPGDKVSSMVCGSINETKICFRAVELLTFEAFPGEWAVADLNNDALDDVVITETSPGKLRMFISSRQSCALEEMNSVAEEANSLLVFDVDGDDDLDINYSLWSPDEQVEVLLFGNGGGSFAKEFTPDLMGAATKIDGDINNDGNADVLSFGASNYAQIFTGAGDGMFTSWPQITLDGYSRPLAALADFNDDSALDIITVYESDGIHLYQGVVLFGGAGSEFSDHINFEVGLTPAPHGVAVGDFDLDNDLDIAVSEYVHYGDGAGGVQKTLHLPDFSPENAVLDVNEDGLIDIVSAGDIYLNRGDEFIGGLSFSPPYKARTGDLNGDGYADVVGIFCDIVDGKDECRFMIYFHVHDG